MPLAHVETTISETTIKMRYADHRDPAQATEWFAFEVPIGPGLTLPTHGDETFLLASLKAIESDNLRLDSV